MTQRIYVHPCSLVDNYQRRVNAMAKELSPLMKERLLLSVISDTETVIGMSHVYTIHALQDRGILQLQALTPFGRDVRNALVQNRYGIEDINAITHDEARNTATALKESWEYLDKSILVLILNQYINQQEKN